MTIKAIIFDMDGLLVDTEPFWVSAQIDILSQLNVPISKETCAQTKGLRIDEVVAHYHHQFPWTSPSINEIAYQIAHRVAQLFAEKGTLLPGVEHALNIAQKTSLPMVLASSSPLFLIDAILKEANILSFFPKRISAENDPFGKPHPAIYIRAAQSLSLRPQDCIAIEDSFFGVLAAKAARMLCIAIPEKTQLHHPHFSIADHTLSSLQEISPSHFA